MITKFKIFESVNELPELGDYVIVDSKVGFGSEDLINFYKNNIGKIIKKNANNWYDVKYENKLKLESGLHIVEISGLKYWSHNREELELILKKEKYNI
jgi:hypothetical protein